MVKTLKSSMMATIKARVEIGMIVDPGEEVVAEEEVTALTTMKEVDKANIQGSMKEINQILKVKIRKTNKKEMNKLTKISTRKTSRLRNWSQQVIIMRQKYTTKASVEVVVAAVVAIVQTTEMIKLEAKVSSNTDKSNTGNQSWKAATTIIGKP